MLKIGLTGSIGSGKSTVAKIFEVLGVPVYYADAEAKGLMNVEPLRSSIMGRFGPKAYEGDILNRAFIAENVFNTPENLEVLNSLVHPVVIEHANQWIDRQSANYVIKEAALLFESGSNKYLDYVIGVSAPEAVRIDRVMKRDGLAKEKILSRQANQLPEDEKLRLCDYVIMNDGRQAILPQVLHLHEKFSLLSEGNN